MNLIAIDPGKKGALVAFFEGEPVLMVPMPSDGKEVDARVIAEFIKDYHFRYKIIPKIYMERTTPNPAFGSRNYSFGEAVGILKGVIAVLGCPLRLVRSQDWKKVILEGTAKDKQAAISYVRQRFPEIDLVPPRCRIPHDGIADAICIGLYGLYLERSAK